MGKAAQRAGQAHVARLMALADRQREEIAQLRNEAAASTALDLARGVLMERLGCSAAEAGGQLDRIAAEAGSAPDELAAQIVGIASPWIVSARTQPPQPTASRLAAAVTDRQPDAAKLASAMLDDALA